MPRKKAVIGGFNDKTRELAAKVNKRRAKMRHVLADKYELRPRDFMPLALAETIRRNNIPLNEVPEELFTRGKPVPLTQEQRQLTEELDRVQEALETARNGNGRSGVDIDAAHRQEEGGTSFPLALIPPRTPAEPKKMGRPVGSTKRHDMVGGPREMIAMRLLDILERLL